MPNFGLDKDARKKRLHTCQPKHSGDLVVRQDEEKGMEGDAGMIGSGRGAAVHLMIALMLLLSVGALGGGAALIVGPNGSLLGLPLGLLAGTPFPDYLIPGTLLFSFLGVYPLVVTYALWRRPAWRLPDLLNPFRRLHWAWTAGLSVGIVLIVWIVSEMMLAGCCHPLQHLYFWWGVLMVGMAVLPPVRRYYVRDALIPSGEVR